MSMIKIIDPSGWSFDGPAAEEVKVSREGLRGNDLSRFIKRAGHYLADEMRKLSFHKGEVPLHVIALGAYEFFGCNRNGDAFTKRACEKFHDTFEKHARWYYDHKNTDTKESYGVIKRSLYNPEMHRVELVVALNGDKESAEKNGGLVASRTLQKLAAGKEVPTSMSCVLDPDSPVLTTNGYKRIEDVRPGDVVHTHKGRWREVTEYNRRVYSGEVVTIRCEGLPYPIELTADHLMRAKRLDKYPPSKNKQRPHGQWTKEVEDGAEAFSWVQAGDLSVNDRIEVTPVGPIPALPSISDTRLAELLGIYTAEGSLQWCKGNLNSVLLTIHADDWAVDGVPKLIHSLWPDVTTTLRPKANSKVSFSLAIFSAELARWMYNLVGDNSLTKRIPLQLFSSDEDCKLAFLGRWLDGDGWCDKKGAHWSSGNLNLILQGRDLLLTMGIGASIYRINHTQGYAGPCREYTLNLSNIDAVRLKPFSKKVSASESVVEGKERKKPTCLPPVGTVHSYRISQIERRTAENAQTYNFEVDEDTSYSLLGLSSHNCRVKYDSCSICGNRARNRGEYCTESTCPGGGLKNHMGETLKSGQVLYADNPEPLFFDISHVVRPADRTAYATGRLDEELDKEASAPPVDFHLDERAQIFEPGLMVVEPLVKLAGELARLDETINHRALAPAFSKEVRTPLALEGPPSGALLELAKSAAVLPHDELLIILGRDREEASRLAPLVSERAPRALRLLAQSEKAASFFKSAIASFSPHWKKARIKNAECYSLSESQVRARLRLAALRNSPCRVSTPLEGAPFDKTGSDLEETALVCAAHAVTALAFAEKHHPLSSLTRAALLTQNRAC